VEAIVAELDLAPAASWKD